MECEDQHTQEYRGYQILVRKGLHTYLWFASCGNSMRSGLALEEAEAIEKSKRFVDETENKQNDTKPPNQTI